MNQLNRQRKLAHFLLFLSIVLLGANFVVVRNIHEQYPPAVMSLWRWGGSALILGAFAWRSAFDDWQLIRQNLGVFAALGFFMPILGALTGYFAMAYTVAVNGAIIQAMLPAFVVLLAWSLHIEKITLQQVIGLIVAAIGVGCIFSRGDIGILKSLRFTAGDLLLLLSASGLACYAVLYKSFTGRPRLLVSLAMICIFGSLYHLPFVLYEFWLGTPMPFTIETTFSIFYVALFPTLVAIMFFNYGIEKIGASMASAYHYLTPVITAVLAYLFLGEALAWFHVVGTVAIIVGVYLSSSKTEVKE